ncbi:MAG: MGMT family protein [Candidatus Kariarchaeaceae archaeon]|jgi:methylated-DNA-protein-cysteine methyltransferase-like protein
MDDFTSEVVEIIGSIPEGKVMTYGGIAKLAGNPRGARQVSRILHSMSKKYGLPWHRVISSQGKISLPIEMGAEEQKARLLAEGVHVSERFRIDLKAYLWIC